MSKQDHQRRLSDVQDRLRQLQLRPKTFDQRLMAQRVELARVLCDDAYALYQRKAGRDKEEATWKEAASLFHRTLEEAYPPGFFDYVEHLRARETTDLSLAMKFLEDDPWFFRSGYVKADLIRLVCRIRPSASDALRLQSVVLAAIDLRDRREFRWYCKLARVVDSSEFQLQVKQRLLHGDEAIRRRAGWVLDALMDGR